MCAALLPLETIYVPHVGSGRLRVEFYGEEEDDDDDEFEQVRADTSCAWCRSTSIERPCVSRRRW